MDSALDDLALLLQHTESYDRFVKHLVEVSTATLYYTVLLCTPVFYKRCSCYSSTHYASELKATV
jgi:hypothetical protein